MFKKLFIATCAVLTISIVVNIFLIIKGGIIVNNTYDQRQDQRQFQFQGQLLMNMYMTQGDSLTWVMKRTDSIEDALKLVAELPPQEAFFNQIIPSTSDVVLIYPHFMKEKK